MIQLSLIGIGTGNPDHVTLAAVNAMNRADLILIPCKGEKKSDLVDLRRLLCRKLLKDASPARIVEFDLPSRADSPDYLADVDDWHSAISNVWGDLIEQHLPKGGKAALMIWGDPSLYDSSLRIAEKLEHAGMPVEITVVPGITSLQVLTAEHRIPLNALAEPVIITTGRKLREAGWPADAGTVAVMLDSGGAFQSLAPDDIQIWWGAYLGMEKQCLMSGRLTDISDQIVARRAELRAEHGWIMDIYLLRRSPQANR